MTEVAGEPVGRRAAVAFIFVTVVLDILALGLVIPILPTLLKQFLSGSEVRATHWFGIFGTAFAAMQFFVSPILGVLSDRFGRRPVILLSNLGLGLDYVLMALAPALGWMFAARLISGVTSGTIPTAFAYIADVTPPEKRAGAFGMVGAAFGLGFVLGPALGGVLGGISIRLPFWVAAGLSLTNALYGFFVLPESLSPGKRGQFVWRKANPVGALVLLRRHRELIGLGVTNFLANLAHEVLPSVFVLYTGYRYHWEPGTIGLTLAGVGICGALMQGMIVRRVVARVGERVALMLGLTFGAIAFVWFGAAHTQGWFWLAIPVMSLWGLAGPSAMGLMSRRVGHDEQGQLQGALGSLRSIAGLIGPGLFTTTFAIFISTRQDWGLPGAPFLLAGCLLLAACGMAWMVTSDPKPQTSTPNIQ